MFGGGGGPPHPSLRMLNLKDAGTTHSMEGCEALCDRIGIMVKGQFACIRFPGQSMQDVTLLLLLPLESPRGRVGGPANRNVYSRFNCFRWQEDQKVKVSCNIWKSGNQKVKE